MCDATASKGYWLRCLHWWIKADLDLSRRRTPTVSPACDPRVPLWIHLQLSTFSKDLRCAGRQKRRQSGAVRCTHLGRISWSRSPRLDTMAHELAGRSGLAGSTFSSCSGSRHALRGNALLLRLAPSKQPFRGSRQRSVHVSAQAGRQRTLHADAMAACRLRHHTAAAVFAHQQAWLKRRSWCGLRAAKTSSERPAGASGCV